MPLMIIRQAKNKCQQQSLLVGASCKISSVTEMRLSALFDESGLTNWSTDVTVTFKRRQACLLTFHDFVRVGAQKVRLAGHCIPPYHLPSPRHATPKMDKNGSLQPEVRSLKKQAEPPS